MLSFAVAHRRALAVDQQIEHVRLGGAVHHGQRLAVEADVEHADLQGRRLAHGGFAGFEIDLDVMGLGEAAQPLAERVDRVARRGEADAAAQADPAQLAQKLAVAALQFAEQGVEAGEIAVLAVVVHHHAVEPVDHRAQARRVGFAQPAEGPRRIGEIEAGAAHAGVQAQALGRIAGQRREALELADRVEDDLVAVGQRLADFVIGEGDAVGVRLAAELLPAELDLVQRRRGGAVHVRAHQVEHRPGGEAFEGQQHLRARAFAHAVDDLQVAQQRGLVDQVVRGGNLGLHRWLRKHRLITGRYWALRVTAMHRSPSCRAGAWVSTSSARGTGRRAKGR